MAPKKAKKGNGKPGDDEGPDQGIMNSMLETHVDSLKQKLVL